MIELSESLPRSTAAPDQLGRISPGLRRPSAEELASRLRWFREARGLPFAALADAVGVSKPTIWPWENGRSKPLPDRINKICEALGVTRDELLEGRESTSLATGVENTPGERQARELLLEAGRKLVAQAWSVDVKQVRILIDC